MTNTNDLLAVREGMSVVDSDENKVGLVMLAYTGLDRRAEDENPGPEHAKPEQWDAISSAFPFDEVRERLLSHGFIKVTDPRDPPKTRFVTGDQIAGVNVEYNTVYLSVAQDELLMA